MKTKLATFAFLACSFVQSSFAADDGAIEVSMLNQQQALMGGRVVFMETGHAECRYDGYVKSTNVAIIDNKVCADGTTTAVSMLVQLDKPTVSASGSPRFKAYEQGPAPVAVSFMTQFYGVPADAVQVTIIEQTQFDAKVKAEATGHVCVFDAGQLPSSQYGWAVASMNCAK